MPQNVAEILADYIRSLVVPPGETPEDRRGFGGDIDDVLQAWRNHVHALNLVRQVEATIDRLEVQGRRVDLYRKALPYWYAGVGFAEIPWGSHTNTWRHAVPERWLDLLDALGTVLDGRPHVEIDDGSRDSLILLVEQAIEAINEDDDLPAEIQTYLLQLMRRARFLLEHLDKYGSEAAREALLELGGALHARADVESDKAKKETLRRLGTQLTSGFMSAMGGAGFKALRDQTLKALEAAEGAAEDGA